MHALETAVLNLAHALPLEIFVALASFLEEVIPPIPSPSVVIFAGTLAALQGYTYIQIAVLVFFASLGKTIGAFTVYTIVKHAGIELIDRFGRILHIEHSDIEKYSSHITGTARDYVLLSILRGIPIIPSVILSFGSGVLRIPVRVFIVGTFIGTVVRDTIYVVIGYTGAQVLKEYAERTSTLETLITMVFGCIFIYGVFTVIQRRRERKKISSPS